MFFYSTHLRAYLSDVSFLVSLRLKKNNFDVIIIGGGQSGLAVAYYLRRTALSYLILDGESNPGGSWQHHWKSLRLFSPALWSSLPGVIMNGGADYYPGRDEVVAYLRNYEGKYNLPVERPVEVASVLYSNACYQLETSQGSYFAKALVSATGTFRNSFIPRIPGMDLFRGKIIHSSQYWSPETFKGKRVAILGEGNSGAQILAEISRVSDTIWITKRHPTFHPDFVDGRYLFNAASKMYEAKIQGKEYKPPSLASIVMVPSVKDARERGILDNPVRPFERFSPHGLIWPGGHEENVDTVIFCTGFKSSLSHLSALNIFSESGNVNTAETRAMKTKGLWLVGYGNWTGFASATLIGVGRNAKATVEQIKLYLEKK